MREAVIVSAVRTPLGKFQGSLQSFSAPQLGALVVREAVRRAASSRPRSTTASWAASFRPASARTPPARPRSLRAPARGRRAHRQPGLRLGTPRRSLAAQAIQTGDAEIVVAGGMESMTNAPYLLPQARSGYRMGNGTLVDAMIHDGLWDVYNDFHMGAAAEMVAEKYRHQPRRAGRLCRRVAPPGRRSHRAGILP